MPSALAASATTATPPIIAAVSAADTASMSPATTEAPADASAAAMDLPIPEPAPVTTATDPSIFMAHSTAPPPRRLGSEKPGR